VAALRAYDAADDSPKFNPLGTPLYLTFRQILEECRTVEEAEQLLKGGTFTTRIILSACDTQRGVLSTPQINLSGPCCPKKVCVFFLPFLRD
jgi:hypothetical protein